MLEISQVCSLNLRIILALQYSIHIFLFQLTTAQIALVDQFNRSEEFEFSALLSSLGMDKATLSQVVNSLVKVCRIAGSYKMTTVLYNITAQFSKMGVLFD